MLSCVCSRLSLMILLIIKMRSIHISNTLLSLLSLSFSLSLSLSLSHTQFSSLYTVFNCREHGKINSRINNNGIFIFIVNNQSRCCWLSKSKHLSVILLSEPRVANKKASTTKTYLQKENKISTRFDFFENDSYRNKNVVVETFINCCACPRIWQCRCASRYKAYAK